MKYIAPLVPILTINTCRQYIFPERSGVRFAEISLDDGIISVDERTASIRELEAELLHAA